MAVFLGTDPGFPVEGHGLVLGRRRQPLTQALFGENVCENERIRQWFYQQSIVFQRSVLHK